MVRPFVRRDTVVDVHGVTDGQVRYPEARRAAGRVAAPDHAVGQADGPNEPFGIARVEVVGLVEAAGRRNGDNWPQEGVQSYEPERALMDVAVPVDVRTRHDAHVGRIAHGDLDAVLHRLPRPVDLGYGHNAVEVADH